MSDPVIALVMLGIFLIIILLGFPIAFTLMAMGIMFGYYAYFDAPRMWRAYDRAVEAELSRSIASLESVKSARVHLAMPNQSVFIRKSEKPAASVLVNLYAGRTLSESQLAGIVHLVASSVPGLEAEQVSVVDQRGQLLSARPQDSEIGRAHV